VYPTSALDAIDRKFTGKERDSETGLDWWSSRYISSAQGRFTSPDPIGKSGADPSDPQSWNQYAYARNNPLRYTDPDGFKYRVCQVGSDGKETNCTEGDNQLSDKSFDQYKKNSGGNLVFTNGNIYSVNQDGSRTLSGTYIQTDVDIDNPFFGAAARGVQTASPVTDPRFIAGFYGASALGGFALYQAGGVRRRRDHDARFKWWNRHSGDIICRFCCWGWPQATDKPSQTEARGLHKEPRCFRQQGLSEERIA
jgi:RHS repeat-associated protein